MGKRGPKKKPKRIPKPPFVPPPYRILNEEEKEIYIVDDNGYPILNKDKSWRKRRGGPVKGAGKKPIEINWQVVESMYKIGATDPEVADALGIAISTLRNKEDFQMFKAKAKSQSKIKVRQNLYRASDEGDTKATIFLAKNVLGMSDKVEQEISQKSEIKIIDNGSNNSIKESDTLSIDELI